MILKITITDRKRNYPIMITIKIRSFRVKYLKSENILHLSSLAVADTTMKERGCHGHPQGLTSHPRVRSLAIYCYYPECSKQQYQ